MITKSAEKRKAITLRKQGKTYNQILAEVPVAKSTLSLWLREVQLSRPQKQQITTRRQEAQRRGAQARRTQRLVRTEEILIKAKANIQSVSRQELMLMGTVLYWAEGSKQRYKNISQGIQFVNMDALLVYLFYRYLQEILSIPPERMIFSIYLHETHRHRQAEVERYWRQQLRIPRLKFKGVYFKQHKPLTKRYNSGEQYHGALTIYVRSSADLQRMISGWMYGIISALK